MEARMTTAKTAPRRIRGCLLLILGMSFAVRTARPCTLALVSGRATTNGRPLMWKNRDTSDPDNKLMFFKGPKYDFIAVVVSGDAKPAEVWGGQNVEGFAVMNSQAGDLAAPGAKDGGDGNGAFMKLALGECATVGDFERLLVREKGKWDLAANFGVIDAEGGACFFEAGRASFAKFDTKDPRVAPFGTIVRTNFAFTSRDPLLGGGFERFERIGHIIEAGRAANRIDVRFILQEASRDLVHEKLHSYPLTRPLPEDPAEPLYVHTNDTINRNTSVSALVFEGVNSRSQAHLATMWVILGQPEAGAAVPVWPAAGKVPAVTTGAGTAPLNDLARAVAAYLYPDRRGRMSQYMNITRLRTYGGEGISAKIQRAENRALESASVRLAEWEKRKPTTAEMADFQESVASAVFEALKKEFADLSPAPPAR
jgi:hypothetical protein